MRLTPLLPLLLLLHAGLGFAVLGGDPEPFTAQDTTLVSKVAQNYTLRDTRLTIGTQVREYVSGKGLVFAVTWSGPFLPELRTLLGKYFDTMEVESVRAPRAGRSHIAINHPEVVINIGGHMRSFEGEAWIPAEMPAGFTVDDGL